MGGGGESRAANSDRGLVLGVRGLGKPDRGLGRGETFFPDSSSDRDSDETFQISRKHGLVHVEFFCLLDSQPWFGGTVLTYVTRPFNKKARLVV
jgi:hypothetical protein